MFDRPFMRFRQAKFYEHKLIVLNSQNNIQVSFPIIIISSIRFIFFENDITWIESRNKNLRITHNLKMIKSILTLNSILNISSLYQFLNESASSLIHHEYHASMGGRLLSNICLGRPIPINLVI